MLELVFISGARAGVTVEVSGLLVAGRSPDCSCEVPDPNASRRHAEFDVTADDQLQLTDLNSANGTFINEQQLKGSICLQNGDIIRMGETRMRFQEIDDNAISRTSLNKTSFAFRAEDGPISDDDLNLSMSLSMAEASQLRPLDADILKQRLQTIMWVSEELASIKSLDALYGPIIDTLFEIFPHADRGFLLRGSKIDALEACAVRHRSGEKSDHLEVSQSLCRAALERKAIFVYDEDGGTDSDFDQGLSIISLNIRKAMVVPLMVKEEVLGLLVIDTANRSRSFTQDDMEVAAAVCRQISVAMKNAMLLAEVEQEAQNRANLSRFLPKPVVDQWVDGEIDIELGGNSYTGTLLFSDVVGFTRMSEKLDPEAVIHLMNSYFDRMIPCIESSGGAIDKFMGDAIMAFWGIPFNDGNCALHGTEAALHMQNALAGFNALQRAENQPTVDMGIGLNTGGVVAGNIGAIDRLEYTVLGDTVNTAQRIESRACYNQVLVSESTLAVYSDRVTALSLPAVKMKNKAEPVNTYSVRGLCFGDEWLLHIPLTCVTDGVQHYVTIIRRLQDERFILLHPAECKPEESELMSDMVELPKVCFGRPEVSERLPQQDIDGGLTRTVVFLPDGVLSDLLGTVVSSSVTWEDMPRARVV